MWHLHSRFVFFLFEPKGIWCYGMLWIDRNIICKLTRYEMLECIMIGCRNEAKVHGM